MLDMTMEHVYSGIVHALKGILQPPPANQLGMREYYRRIVCILEDVKQQIDDLILTMEYRLREYEQ
jgi:hypothetical protein